MTNDLQSEVGIRKTVSQGAYEFTTDWVTGHESGWCRLFADLIDKPEVRFLEIGCFEGHSSVWWLENILTDPTAELTCVDVWWQCPERERRFDRNILATGRSDRVRKTKDQSARVLPRLRERSFDAVYIDGSHEGHDVLLDALLAWRVLKVGGVMLFDDYGWTGDRHHMPKPAIDAFLLLNDYRLELLDKGYQVAVQKTV